MVGIFVIFVEIDWKERTVRVILISCLQLQYLKLLFLEVLLLK